MQMESNSTITREDDQMELPPGFRFHPTDEELITHYLAEKVLDNNFTTIAIGEADLNKIEPWDLPRQAKMGEKELYFFVVRDRKYPTGLRTNRATEAGYWKATGKDKEIYRAKSLVGMKKTLVFYTGRAPKGEKTNWIMHEYRLDGKYSSYNLPQNAKNDWVISRIFNKSYTAKKSDVAETGRVQEIHQSLLPPLMDSSTNSINVTCFSNASLLNGQLQAIKQEEMGMFGTSTSTNLGTPYSKSSLCNVLSQQNMPDFHFPDSLFTQDESMLKLLLEGKGTASNNYEIPTIHTLSNFSNHHTVPTHHDSLWDY